MPRRLSVDLGASGPARSELSRALRAISPSSAPEALEAALDAAYHVATATQTGPGAAAASSATTAVAALRTSDIAPVVKVHCSFNLQ
jgi:hypothetical protein